MRKQIITEISRIREMMGVNPTKRLLTEGGQIIKVFRTLIDKFARKVGGNADLDDLFVSLLLKRKGGGWDMGEWKRMMSSGPNKVDLLDTYPNPQALLDDLGNDFYKTSESEALLRVLTGSRYMEELVVELIDNPKTFKEFQILFPSGTVGQEGKNILGKALNQDPEDEFITALTRRLNKNLKKVDITIPFIGTKLLRTKVPFVFRRGWWRNFGNNWKFKINGKINKRWRNMGWLLGVASVTEFLNRTFPSLMGLGDIYGGGGIKKEAFSRSFYDNKLQRKSGDDNWIERNEIPEDKLAEIIQDLKNAGVGKSMDIGVDDMEIIRIYKDDIKNGDCGPTYFQASQVATEWYRQTNGDLNEDILKSMNFPIKTVVFQWGANLAAEIINGIAGAHIDWSDTTIVDFYKVFDMYYADCGNDGSMTRDVTQEIFSEDEKQEMFRMIPQYPNTLRDDETKEVYCSKWSSKIHPEAWIELAQDKADWQEAKQYIRKMDPGKFNEIHNSVVPAMGWIYEISTDGTSEGCGTTKQTIADYVDVFDKVHSQIEKSIIDANKEDDGT